MPDFRLSAADTAAIEASLGHAFARPRLLSQALVHRSYYFEHRRTTRGHNETLEFLGDAVLDLVIAALLIGRFPKMTEGELTKLRAALVCAPSLAEVARGLDLGRFIRLGRGEEKTGGRDKESILACTYEAVIGAVFKDGGYEAARQVVERHFADRVDSRQGDVLLTDAKSRLQELTQGRYGVAPTYRVEGSSGPDHDRVFTVSVALLGVELGRAAAGSKKMAEQRAAAAAIGAAEREAARLGSLAAAGKQA